MDYPILTDDDGCCRSLRSSCTQPTMSGSIDKTSSSAAYTAILIIYELPT